MNSAKYAFGISANNFLGFLVHHRGIEVDENKARTIINTLPPMTKKPLQSLLDQEAFSTPLKLKDSDKFEWRENHQATFTQSRFPIQLHPSSYRLGVVNLLSYTFRWPRSPSVTSLHKATMSGVSRPSFISVGILTHLKSIIQP
ncbi:hypothetical protein ACFX1Z_014153 [Malus domestica]